VIDQKIISRSLGNLIGWLETWNANGAYNGFVVHRTEAKRMGAVHDTAWTQSAMIRGYGNLYRKSHESRWYDAMIKAADLFAGRYDPQTGRIKHTGHEDERFQSLVSCALGICSLLSIWELVDEDRQRTYLHLSSDHAKRYWIDVLWVEKEGAFKFSEVDFYSPGQNRFVVNFNTMAVEALIALYHKTEDVTFKDKALRVGKWLLERWAYTQKINTQLLPGKSTIAQDPDAKWMAPGGFSYQFMETDREPDNYVTIYIGLSLRGLYALYSLTRDERYAEMIQSQSRYLFDMRDKNTRLFFHTAKKGIIDKNPQFVAGAGMTLVGLHEVMSLLDKEIIFEDTITSILGSAHANGSYAGFIGKNDTGLFRRNSGGVVWEDVAASINWNAQWFEFLTCLIDDPRSVEIRECKKIVRRVSSRFLYQDKPASVFICSWSPMRSWGLYWYIKKRPWALLAVNPQKIYSRIRESLRNLRH